MFLFFTSLIIKLLIFSWLKMKYHYWHILDEVQKVKQYKLMLMSSKKSIVSKKQFELRQFRFYFGQESGIIQTKWADSIGPKGI